MKKQLAAFMAATMMMGTLAACGGSTSTAASTTDTADSFIRHLPQGYKLCR